MTNALFHEKEGYYRTKNPLGKDADFITAPEISPVFGELIASYLLHIIAEKKCQISLVEMGAGRGLMMRDILNLIKKLADKKIPQALDFLSRTDFHIIEINEVLKKVQQENLQDFSVIWHKNFAEFLPKNREIIFISNELFDCFPIDQFVQTEIGWCERIVVGNNFTLADFDKKTHQFVENEVCQLAPIGAVFEYSLEARNFMKELCEALITNGGMAINFDYGYFKNDFSNTLQSLKNHKKTHVLDNVGNQDITARVDFAALDKIAKNYGLNSSLITQREFLISLGIEERRQNLLKQNPQFADKINSSIDRLIDENQMGELFKCHIIWKE